MYTMINVNNEVAHSSLRGSVPGDAEAISEIASLPSVARNDVPVRTGTAFLITFLILAIPLFAQEQPLPKLAPDAAAQKQIQSPDNLYLDFRGAALINVLAVLSELSGINYVAGTEVAERQVNMVLDNVTIQDALEAISQGTNVVYEYLPNKKIYLFRASAYGAELPQLETRVFKLYYIRASELREIEGEGGSSGSGTTGGTTFAVLTETKAEGESSSSILKIIESMLSERGRVKVDDRSNSLVVTDTEDRIRMIGQAVTELDRAVDQVLINTALIETFEDFDRFLGIEWGTTGNEGSLAIVTPGSQPTKFPFNFFNDLKRLPGTDGQFNDFGNVADAGTAGTNSWATMVVTLKALQSANKLRILAKPKILVLDNHPALIKITTNETIGSQNTTASADAISTASTSAERTETGTSLRVTPLINTNNRITMTLEPRFVTAAAGLTIASTNATRDPTIRTARTTLMVNDGQTIVLGGLLSSQQTDNVRKVPLLGDVPFIGEIFTRRTKQIDDRELILFVTPTIVRDPSEVQALSVPDYRDRFDDVTAPFWKWKKKKWYKDIRKEIPAQTTDMDSYIQSRDRSMDEAFKNLTAKPVETKKVTVTKPVPAKSSDTPKVEAKKVVKPST